MTTDDRIAFLSRLYRTTAWRQLCKIAGHIEAAEELVRQFRKEHPPGHRCLTCQHLREKEEDLEPAGPFALLGAVEVVTWQFSAMLSGDLGLMTMLPGGRTTSKLAGVS